MEGADTKRECEQRRNDIEEMRQANEERATYLDKQLEEINKHIAGLKTAGPSPP